MQPKNTFILPFLGLILPIGFYFIVASFIAPIFSALQISNDILLAALGFCYLLVVSYSNIEAKSQSKFFNKYFTIEKNEDSAGIDTQPYVAPQLRRGTAFFINVVGNLIAITLWIFFSPTQFSESIGVSNIWYQIVVLLIIMFFLSNTFKIIATTTFSKSRNMTSLNSMKFNIASDLFFYGIIALYFLFMGGFFV